MEIKKVSVPLTSYPRYAYTSSLATRIYKRFNYLLNKTELNDHNLHSPPTYGNPDVYIIHATPTVKHLNESAIKLKRISGKLDNVHRLPTKNELQAEDIGEFKEKVLVVVTDNVDESIDLVGNFTYNTVVACSTGGIASSITEKHTFIQEWNVPVVDMGVSDSVALAIDGVLERIVFRQLNELLNVLASFEEVNKTRLVQEAVSDKMTDFMRGILCKGAKTIQGIFKEVELSIDARSPAAETKDITDTGIYIPDELSKIDDIKDRYTEELSNFYMLLHKMSVDISRTIEQFVHGKCRELPLRIKELFPIPLDVGSISETLQVDVLKLLVEQFPKDMELEYLGDTPEVDTFLEILTPKKKQIVEELVKMINTVSLVQEVDRRINRIKELYDSSFHRLLWEIKSMYNRSKVPKTEQPRSGNEGKRLSPKVAKRLFERVNIAVGTGYRCGKLNVYIRENSNTERDEVATAIKDVLAEFHILDFSVVSSKETVTHYRRVGAAIKAARNGTLGGFAWMTGKDKAGVKKKGDTGTTDGNRQLCALLSKHVINGADKIYLCPSPPNNEMIQIGSIVHTSEPRGPEPKTPSVDVAAAKIISAEQSRCKTKFRNSSNKPLPCQLFTTFDDLSYLNALSVHLVGASTKLGLGTITIPEFFARDPPEKEFDSEVRYVIIEDIEPVGEARFCAKGDSGAIICADEPAGEYVIVISMLIGSLYREIKQGCDTNEQYITFRMTDGLNKLQEETGCTFNLCSE